MPTAKGSASRTNVDATARSDATTTSEAATTTATTSDATSRSEATTSTATTSDATTSAATKSDAEPVALAPLAGGYALTIRDAGVALDLHAPDGRLCVRLVLAPEGPRIEVAGASLAVHAEREIALSCRTFAVEASEAMTLRSGGDLQVQADGAIRSEGFSQAIVARRGDVDIDANDDVTVAGERIRLNSPEPTFTRR